MNGDRIAVIGAGPMGLSVAWQLLLEGYVPVIFETDDRIGGMASTFDFGGLDIERFYHFLCISDNALFNLLEELDLKEKIHWVETRMGYYYQGKLQPWGNPFALLRFSGLDIISKIRYGLHTFFSTRRNDWRLLDGVEATNWIKRWVGNKAFDVLWSNLFEYKFYEYAHELSAAWIWSRIRRIGRSRYSLFREKLGYIEGGSTTLLQAMKVSIELRGGEFHLSSPVEKVVLDGNTVTGVYVCGSFHSFKTVVCTTPLPYIPIIVPELPKELMQAFLNIKNIAVVCVIVKLKKKVSGNFWLNINDPCMDIPGLVEYTNLRPMVNHHIVYVPFYMPGEHPKYREDDKVFMNKVRRYIKVINPDLCDEDFSQMHVSRYRYAQPVCGPVYLDTIPPVQLPITGLWVADTSYYYPEDRGISESIGFGRELAKKITK
jgi:protoporphyrinogen oxidase